MLKLFEKFRTQKTETQSQKTHKQQASKASPSSLATNETDNPAMEVSYAQGFVQQRTHDGKITTYKPNGL